MAADGKQLEALVAYVEKTLLPGGFSVKTNKRVFNEEGIQVAEFDIEVSGKVGSRTIAWLIECRDRPTSGPAPGAWIEQLVGRRIRFGFNKVTAVSTTGFAAGAVEFAIAQGIEMREVRSLAPDEFDWLVIRHLRRIERLSKLDHASLIPHGSGTEAVHQALVQFLSQVSPTEAFLRSSTSGEHTTPAKAFLVAVAAVEGIFDDLTPNEAGKRIQLHVQYSADDHFYVDTDAGSARVGAIVFEGELRLVETLLPLISTAEYRRSASGEIISQLASFEPQSIHGMKFSTEFHKMAETGKTHVILRRLVNNA